jgi:hypothetical protein
MKDHKGKSEEETRRREARDAEEARSLAKERERKRAYLVREQAIEKAAASKRSERVGAGSIEETERLTREQVRKEAYSANEKRIAQAQEARKLKAGRQPPR